MKLSTTRQKSWSMSHFAPIPLTLRLSIQSSLEKPKQNNFTEMMKTVIFDDRYHFWILLKVPLLSQFYFTETPRSPDRELSTRHFTYLTCLFTQLVAPFTSSATIKSDSLLILDTLVQPRQF